MKNLLFKILNSIASKLKIKNIIVLESLPIYTDSSAQLYNYLIENKYNEKYKIIWLTSKSDDYAFKEKNVYVKKIWDDKNHLSIFGLIKYFMIVKNAKYLIYCNRNLRKFNSKGKTIYMGHGLPLKNVKNLNIIPKDVDNVLSSSDYVTELLSDQLNVDIEKFVQTGFPRNDMMTNYQVIQNRKFTFIKNEYSKIILWMPTFRNQTGTSRTDSTFEFPLGIPVIYDEETLTEIDKYLREKDTLLLIKPHPVQDVTKIKNIELDNIKLITDKDLSKNDILLFQFYYYVDAYMTDYSGVYYDALIANKPIGFTIDDFESYKESRGFPFDNPLEMMAGNKIRTIEELKIFIDDVANDNDRYQKERKDIRKKFYSKLDGKSSERLAKHFRF